MATKTAVSIPFPKYAQTDILISNILTAAFASSSGFTVPENKRLIYRLTFNPSAVLTIGSALLNANVSASPFIEISGSDGQGLLIASYMVAIPPEAATLGGLSTSTSIAIAKPGSLITAYFRVRTFQPQSSLQNFSTMLFPANSTSFFHINGFLEDDI